MKIYDGTKEFYIDKYCQETKGNKEEQKALYKNNKLKLYKTIMEKLNQGKTIAIFIDENFGSLIHYSLSHVFSNMNAKDIRFIHIKNFSDIDVMIEKNCLNIFIAPIFSCIIKEYLENILSETEYKDFVEYFMPKLDIFKEKQKQLIDNDCFVINAFIAISKYWQHEYLKTKIKESVLSQKDLIYNDLSSEECYAWVNSIKYLSSVETPYFIINGANKLEAKYDMSNTLLESLKTMPNTKTNIKNEVLKELYGSLNLTV